MTSIGFTEGAAMIAYLLITMLFSCSLSLATTADDRPTCFRLNVTLPQLPGNRTIEACERAIRQDLFVHASLGPAVSQNCLLEFQVSMYIY